ncbi:MAG: M56 family metallopeptidase [Thermoguttaceae bacterium]
MNPLGLMRDILSQFSIAPPWAQLLTKATLLLAVAWVVHFSLARANPRWRILLWRGTVPSLVLMAVWIPSLPRLEIRIRTPEPVAAAPARLPQPMVAERDPPVVEGVVVHRAEAPASVAMKAIPQQDPGEVRLQAAPATKSSGLLLSWPVALLGIWGFGVALLVIRLATALVRLARLLRSSQVASDEIVAEVERISAALRCRRAVRVRISRLYAVPFQYGLRRPVLVLPERMCQPGYRGQLPGVVAHELAHVRSWDFGWNAAVQVVSTILWFHPLTWWIGSAHRSACDAVCDAVSASYLGDVQAYCQTLAEVALEGAASFPALGLAMARTCDIRRRIAMLQQRVFAAALSRDSVIAIVLVGLLSSALLAGVRFALTEPMPQATERESVTSSQDDVRNNQPAKPETLQPVSIPAEDFSRLSAADQRSLLVHVFQRRLEQSHNLYYEVEESWKFYENHNGELGTPRKDNPESRCRYRHWRLRDSFRVDQKRYENPNDAEPSYCSSCGLNSAEGVARNTGIDLRGKTPPHGQVQYPYPDDCSDRYIYWFDRKDPRPNPILGEYLFPYLISHQEQFDIKSPIAGGKVQLTVPWQPWWTTKPGGKREYILDPEKGFLPVRCDSRWDDATLVRGKPQWRIEKLAVGESRLVGDVWMPTKLTDETIVSHMSDMIAVCEMKVSRVEPGTVRPGDLFVPFTGGMQIHDTIEGVTYVTDAAGNAAAPIKLEPNWKSEPPKGWHATAAGNGNALSMASRFSPADRKRLDAERKVFDEKNDQQRNAIEASLKVMRSPAALDERVEAGLKVLRTYTLGPQNDERLWASVVRELIEIGKPAVPKLTEELDRTEREWTLRALGFVLRGIGDPRAAPALIRAIPRLSQPSGSDFGLLIKDDPELAHFMREHDNAHQRNPGQPADGSGYLFSYGRPFYEIMPALEKLVGGIDGWQELRFVQLDGGFEQQRRQRKLFLKLAEDWADWWSKNWRKHVNSEAEAQLDQTTKVLEKYSRSLSAASHQPRSPRFPCGPNVVVGGGAMNGSIHSFDESPADGFLDLDTGRLPNPPANLVKNVSGYEPSRELLAWAGQEGVDLITIKIKSSDGKWFYAFKPLGMTVWRIENSRFDHIERELHESKQLKLPSPWEGPLAQIDEKNGQYDDKLTVSFLFITKEGICGAMQIRSPLVNAGYTDGGLHYKFVY